MYMILLVDTAVIIWKFLEIMTFNGFGWSWATWVTGIVVTTGIEPSSNIGNALVSAMYGRSSELGLYLWGNPPLPPVQGLPPPAGGG